MRIYSFSKILALPFAGVFIYLLYLQFGLNYNIGLYLLIPVGIVFAIYFLSGDIDFWYLSKNPLDLDEPVINWLIQFSPFYQNLTEQQKEKYNYRLSMYIVGRSFKSVGSEKKDLPTDFKAIIASQAVEVSWRTDDYLIGDYDYIFVYKHPFQTPRKQFLHTVETEFEDGVIIYSLEHLMPGITNPEMYYNIGRHAYAEAFIRVHPTKDYPELADFTWQDIVQISGLSQEKIIQTLGFKEVDLLVILITCFFSYPEKFESVLPSQYVKLNTIFSNATSIE